VGVCSYLCECYTLFMQGIIIYATHTGNTYMVSKTILEEVSSQMPLLMKKAKDVVREDLDDASVLLIGSSSWDWQGNRGYPIDEMMKFLDSMGEVDLSGKKIMLFGCGDRDYEHFCGALDVIGEKVRERGGQIMGEPLRVDKYYLNEAENKKLVVEWCESVRQKIKSFEE